MAFFRAASCAWAGLLLFAQQDYLADGLKALDSDQPAAAEPLFRQAVSADPADFTAHFNLALALSLQQKDAEAIQELRRTLELRPGLYQAETNLATLLLRNHRAAEAVPLLKDAVAQKPSEPRADLLYAQALFETGDVAQAASWYGKASELDPKSAAALLGLARCELRTSQLPEAAEHFRAAAALDPQLKPALREVAAEYERARRLPEAIAIYREFPDNPAARERLAQLEVDAGHYAAAIPGLEAAVRQSPSVGNRIALADAYKLNNQLDKAIEQLQLASASEPSNYDLHMDLGRALRDQRRLVPAAQQFAAAAKIRPNEVKAWNELAAVLVVSEDYAGGLAALDHVRALGKEVPGDFFYRAISLERLRQPKPALEAYRQFLAADAGKMPDQEFQARQRVRIIENELRK